MATSLKSDNLPLELSVADIIQGVLGLDEPEAKKAFSLIQKGLGKKSSRQAEAFRRAKAKILKEKEKKMNNLSLMQSRPICGSYSSSFQLVVDEQYAPNGILLSENHPEYEYNLNDTIFDQVACICHLDSKAVYGNEGYPVHAAHWEFEILAKGEVFIWSEDPDAVIIEQGSSFNNANLSVFGDPTRVWLCFKGKNINLAHKTVETGQIEVVRVNHWSDDMAIIPNIH